MLRSEGRPLGKKSCSTLYLKRLHLFLRQRTLRTIFANLCTCATVRGSLSFGFSFSELGEVRCCSPSASSLRRGRLDESVLCLSTQSQGISSLYRTPQNWSKSSPVGKGGFYQLPICSPDERETVDDVSYDSRNKGSSRRTVHKSRTPNFWFSVGIWRTSPKASRPYS